MFKRTVLMVILLAFGVSCNSGHLKLSAADILPRKGYVFVKKIVDIHACKKKKCMQDRYVAVGSGFIVKTSYKGSYVVTAAHVCLPAKSLRANPKIKLRTRLKVETLSGRYFNAKVLDYNSKIDACMMFVEDMVSDVETVNIAERGPKEGDKIFNIASPYGIHSYNVIPLFEGRYIGRTMDDDMYVFPAAPGSSGSMILNEKGELIGLLHSVYMRMKQVVLSVRYDDLKQFIRRNLIENSQEKYQSYNQRIPHKL